MSEASDAIVELHEDVHESPLYSADLAPVPASKRTWGLFDLAAIWVGMAVCIPTYLLASYMIRSGMGWVEALIIIFLANLIVTVPMMLNGHAGVKYGIPFPVLGRASFGVHGVHIPSIVRAIVACGWFGVQTWIGGLAFYAIWCAVTGSELQAGLTAGKFVGFGLFWLVNIFFIWRGTESIRWLEDFAAPILVIIGLILIFWGAQNGGGPRTVLEQSQQLQRPTVLLNGSGSQDATLVLNPLKDRSGLVKATHYRVESAAHPGLSSTPNSAWKPLGVVTPPVVIRADSTLLGILRSGGPDAVRVQFRNEQGDISSFSAAVSPADAAAESRWSDYIFWLTAMVGFWATMSISIADITRYTRTQKQQMLGQMLGLPGTMLLYSFVGVFVTCASLILFDDILIGEDAPWDPVSLLAKFESPTVVIIAQIFMIIATLSTNIAANVIAPANAFANAFPKKVDFARGGVITGLIGIAICPWWLLDEISNLLIFVSGLLGPVLGVMLSDYFLVRKTRLQLAELFKPKGAYSYSGGVNTAALFALTAGVLTALIGYWVPALQWLYTLSWFTGFLVSFTLYYFLMQKPAADRAG